jgi:hypothetical protein
MRKVFFDRLEYDVVDKLKEQFDNGDNSIFDELELFLNKIEKQQDVDFCYDVSLNEQIDFFGGGILRFFNRLIKSYAPLEFEEQDNIKFYRWHFGSSPLETSQILCEIANLQAIYEQQCLLITFNAYHSQPIFIIRDENLEDGTCFTSFERISYCNEVTELIEWLDKKLKFEHNPKHDAQKRKHNKGEIVSILYRNPKTEKAEIENLLNTAILDGKRLYNFDEKTGYYIVFHPHGDKLYHAFHLEDESQLPPKIIKDIPKPKKKK